MGTPHLHREIIKAWADGAEIQTRLDASVMWTDVVSDSPSFSPTFEYRIKPKIVKREGWVNIYRAIIGDDTRNAYGVHATAEAAKTAAAINVVATVKVEWEEEE